MDLHRASDTAIRRKRGMVSELKLVATKMMVPKMRATSVGERMNPNEKKQLFVTVLVLDRSVLDMVVTQ